jgi:hypothetical protein
MSMEPPRECPQCPPHLHCRVMDAVFAERDDGQVLFVEAAALLRQKVAL